MVLTTNAYNSLRHRDLAPLEEAIFLILAEKEEYNDPISTLDLADGLEITPQYLNKVFRQLEGKNYIKRGEQITVNFGMVKLHTLPIAFLLDEEMTFKTKMALIYIYDAMAITFRLNVAAMKFNRHFSYVDAMDALEHITDNGYMLLGEKIDFNRVFNLISRYDD